MAGRLLRHRRLVATAMAAVAVGLVVAARWAEGNTASDDQPWARAAAIAAVVYCAVTTVLFVYLGTERAREALADGGSDSAVATARLIVAVSPSAVVSVLHLGGADTRVLWAVLGATVVQLIAWCGLPRMRRTAPHGGDVSVTGS